MTEPRVLIIGAGLAGLSASITLAEEGLSTLVVDQAPTPGGNIHRQPIEGVKPVDLSTEQTRRWQRILAQLKNAQDRIELRYDTRFAGLDYRGDALICSLSGESSEIVKPSGLIIATGAVERVQPRPGWTLPGVMTAGAIQTSLKASGLAPPGKTVLAGSGPLLLAVGAQLSRAGNPPLAIVEAGRPFSRPYRALRLPLSYLREALQYLAILAIARVPVFSGSHIKNIIRNDKDGQLRISFATSSGKTRSITADILGLHDGLHTNDYGIDETAEIPIRKTGDCREILGARAAELDGCRIGKEVAGILTGEATVLTSNRSIELHRRAQITISELYSHDGLNRLGGVADDTVICRCENRTLADLRSLSSPTLREARLVARFAMGPCQGRFCAEWVQHLLNHDQSRSDHGLSGQRWPVLPVSVRSIVNAKDSSNFQTETKERLS